MPRYEVQHNYKSNDFGPWVTGDQITLDNPEDAAFVNRDSPGTLVEIDPEEAAAKKRARLEQQTAKKTAGRTTGKL
ncbi:MAG TPA: hypothetical protein VIQ30_05475 [Pseudonocardia sp.]